MGLLIVALASAAASEEPTPATGAAEAPAVESTDATGGAAATAGEATGESAGTGEEEVGGAAPMEDTEAAETIEPPPAKAAYPGPRPYLLLGGMTGFDMRFADAVNDFGFGGAEVVDVKPGIGMTARVGVRDRFWALELAIDAIPAFRAEALGFEAFKYTHVYTGLNGRLYLPLGLDMFQPNLIAGGGWDYLILKPQGGIGSRQSFAGGAFRGGGGVDVYMTDHVALSVDATYVVTTGDIAESDYLALGWALLYRF